MNSQTQTQLNIQRSTDEERQRKRTDFHSQIDPLKPKGLAENEALAEHSPAAKDAEEKWKRDVSQPSKYDQPVIRNLKEQGWTAVNESQKVRENHSRMIQNWFHRVENISDHELGRWIMSETVRGFKLQLPLWGSEYLRQLPEKLESLTAEIRERKKEFEGYQPVQHTAPQPGQAPSIQLDRFDPRQS